MNFLFVFRELRLGEFDEKPVSGKGVRQRGRLEAGDEQSFLRLARWYVHVTILHPPASLSCPAVWATGRLGFYGPPAAAARLTARARGRPTGAPQQPGAEPALPQALGAKCGALGAGEDLVQPAGSQAASPSRCAPVVTCWADLRPALASAFVMS